MVRAPADAALAEALGDAAPVWHAILAAVSEKHGPLVLEWKPSKSTFGRMCHVVHEDRTLLYLTPERNEILIAMVLGERAVAIALTCALLPDDVKTLIANAPRYVEGRGFRFIANSMADVPVVSRLVDIKTTPR